MKPSPRPSELELQVLGDHWSELAEDRPLGERTELLKVYNSHRESSLSIAASNCSSVSIV